MIHDIWRAERRKDELEKQGKYDINVFKDNNSSNDKEEVQSDSVALTKKDCNIFIKILNKLKSIFKRK